MLFSEHISEYALTTSPQMVLNMLLWKCCFTSTETVGLSGTGAEDVHLDFHTAPELCDLVDKKKDLTHPFILILFLLSVTNLLPFEHQLKNVS